MCGRFSLETTKAEIAKEFKCASVAYNYDRYNIAPSQDITVVINGGESNEAVEMRWGLIPSWVKSLDSWKSNLINARVETVGEKPSFRSAFKHRPGLIPTSGFYEWSKDKQPHFFRLKDHQLFALAGLWESWSNGEDELVSCTILTTKANTEAAKVHHRMPVIIPTKYYDLWLGDVDERKELIEALPEVELQLYPVSKKVNSPKNDSPDCIEPI